MLRAGGMMRAGVVMAALMVVGGKACAFLETGTLLTNAASATYLGGNQGTSVTYSATAKILVANPAVFMWKKGGSCDPNMQAGATPTYIGVVGGVVQFRVCFSNGGANTAFNGQIVDRVPNDAEWISGSGWFGKLNGSPTTFLAVGGVRHCHDNTCTPSAGPWASDYPTAGDATPTALGGVNLFVRWMTGASEGLGIGASGCVTYQVNFLP